MIRLCRLRMQARSRGRVTAVRFAGGDVELGLGHGPASSHAGWRMAIRHDPEPAPHPQGRPGDVPDRHPPGARAPSAHDNRATPSHPEPPPPAAPRDGPRDRRRGRRHRRLPQRRSGPDPRRVRGPRHLRRRRPGAVPGRVAADPGRGPRRVAAGAGPAALRAPPHAAAAHRGRRLPLRRRRSGRWRGSTSTRERSPSCCLVGVGIFLLRRGGPSETGAPAVSTAAVTPAAAAPSAGVIQPPAAQPRPRGTALAAGLVHHRRHADRHRHRGHARPRIEPGPAAGPVLRPGADGDRRRPAHRLMVGTGPCADPARRCWSCCWASRPRS